MITLHPTTESVERFRQVFTRIMDVAGDEGLSFEMFKEGHDIWADRVHEIFNMEGDPRWMPLRFATWAERARYGYPMDHPILRRTRTLEDGLTDRNEQVHFERLPNAKPDVPVLVGNVTDKVNTSGGVVWRFATLDARFLSLQEGDARGWPPRPMVPINEQRDEVCRDIERRVIEIIRGALHNG